MVSFRLDAGISKPPLSTSSTKFLVAVANMSQLDKTYEGDSKAKSEDFLTYQSGEKYHPCELVSNVSRLNKIDHSSLSLKKIK